MKRLLNNSKSVDVNEKAGLRTVIRPGTRRGLDFVMLSELRKRTSIMPNEVLKFAMSCYSKETYSLP